MKPWIDRRFTLARCPTQTYPQGFLCLGGGCLNPGKLSFVDFVPQFRDYSVGHWTPTTQTQTVGGRLENMD